MNDLLSQLRPPTPTLDPDWSTRTLAAITAAPAAPVVLVPRSRRLRRSALLVAAAAAAVAVAMPVVDSEDAVAADLQTLARAAASTTDTDPAAGTWLHERVESQQTGLAPDGGVLAVERESWTSWDGRTYLVERRSSQGTPEYYLLDDAAPPSYQEPTPAFAATLPSDAEALLAYLDPRVFGSSSHDEAMFEALIGLATSHTLPAPTLAAAYEALATIDGVATRDLEVDGRPAIEITYTEQQTASSDSVTVDRATGQVVSAAQRSRQGEYTATTTLAEVVDSVPAAVRDAAEESDTSQ